MKNTRTVIEISPIRETWEINEKDKFGVFVSTAPENNDLLDILFKETVHTATYASKGRVVGYSFKLLKDSPVFTKYNFKRVN